MHLRTGAAVAAMSADVSSCFDDLLQLGPPLLPAACALQGLGDLFDLALQLLRRQAAAILCLLLQVGWSLQCALCRAVRGSQDRSRLLALHACLGIGQLSALQTPCTPTCCIP